MIDPMIKALLDRGVEVLADTPVRMGRPCKLCNHPSHHFDYVDFNKSCNDLDLGRSGILVEYFRCQNCELVFTDFFDAWSPEEFSAYIYNAAYSKVDPEYESIRPRHAADELLPTFRGAESARILDYGSGSGQFEREMRARGFASIESYDPFSHPVRPGGKFDIITCFDVIEHSPTPLATLEEIIGYLAEDGCLLVGQTLQPADIGSIRGDWWYVAPRNGHVTLYSSETMHLYAEAAGLRFDDFGDLFSLTFKSRSALTEAIVERRRPQPRRVELGAPPGKAGSFSGWHLAEPYGAGEFRWTREATIWLGAHVTPVGEFRVILQHLGTISRDFLKACRIRIADQDSPIHIREGMLYALFHFPDGGTRDIVLVQPPIPSPLSLGLSEDNRPLGLAITCVQG